MLDYFVCLQSLKLMVVVAPLAASSQLKQQIRDVRFVLSSVLYRRNVALYVEKFGRIFKLGIIAGMCSPYESLPIRMVSLDL